MQNCLFFYATHNYVLRVDEKLFIKVADFGFARDIYTSQYYRMDKHTTLPVKWMPLESLLDGYFDEKTDVVRVNLRTYMHMCVICSQLLTQPNDHNIAIHT